MFKDGSSCVSSSVGTIFTRGDKTPTKRISHVTSEENQSTILKGKVETIVTIVKIG